MKRIAPLALFAPMASIMALGTCSDDAPPMENPDVLWLALDGRETQVQLIGEEPQPY